MVTKQQDGTLTVAFSSSTGAEEWLLRTRALTNLIKSAKMDMVSESDLYYAVDLLEDLLPTTEQMMKIMEN